MKHLNSLALLSAGSLALVLCSTAARADSIPTLTATSVTYSHGGTNSWTISGNSFGVGGAGETSGGPLFFNVGERIADLYLPFADTIGATAATTTGYAILNGVTQSVELGPTPQFVFSPSSTYNPVIELSQPNPNLPGAFDTITTVPVAVTTFEIYTNADLTQLYPYCGFQSAPCSDNVLANVAIDLPGILTINGYQVSGENYGFITTVDFTTTPEPVSFELAAAGMIVVLGLIAFRRRQTMPHDKIKYDLRRAAGISL